MGYVSGVTFIYAAHVGHSTLADHGWRPDPPGGPLLTFFTLMVGAPRSLSTPSRGPTVDVS
jgi:hypothetical protein